MESDAKLDCVYVEGETKLPLEAQSNLTKMVVDVDKKMPPDPPPVVVDVKEITVNKVWSDGAEAHKNDKVIVGLYADGKLCENGKQELSAKNN